MVVTALGPSEADDAERRLGAQQSVAPALAHAGDQRAAHAGLAEPQALTPTAAASRRWLLANVPADSDALAVPDVIGDLLGRLAEANRPLASIDPEQRRDAIVSSLNIASALITILSAFVTDDDHPEYLARPLVLLARQLQGLPAEDLRRLFRNVNRLDREGIAASVDLLMQHTGTTLQQAATIVGRRVGWSAEQVCTLRDNVQRGRLKGAQLGSFDPYRTILKVCKGAGKTTVKRRIERLLGKRRDRAATAVKVAKFGKSR
jgi:hypothetical protein